MFKKLIAVLVIVVSMSLLSAEKYAVLITGDYADDWQNGDPEDFSPMEEFWNDTFLMWEMLVTKMDYKPENVYVLFADGVDYWAVANPQLDIRYTPMQYFNKPGFDFIYPDYQISENEFNDGAATLSNLQQIAGALNDKMKDEDFLFVFGFDHGGSTDTANGNSYLYLMDQTITDVDFANLFNPIPAYKKVYWMQQCYGGGFEYELTHDMSDPARPVLPNVYFHSASQQNQQAVGCDGQVKNLNEYIAKDEEITPKIGAEGYLYDNYDPTQPIVDEHEEYNEKKYTHCEFTYLLYSATMGHNPNFEEYYYKDLIFDGKTYPDVKFSDADGLNGIYNHFTSGDWDVLPFFYDGLITLRESSLFEKKMESIGIETPLISDFSNIGMHTSLLYPTVIFNEWDNSYINTRDYELKGIIGIVNDVWLFENDIYNIASNSNLLLGENSNLSVLSKLNIGYNSQISGEENSYLEVYNLELNNNNIQVDLLEIGLDNYIGSMRMSGENDFLNTELNIKESSWVKVERDGICRINSGSVLNVFPNSQIWLDYGSELIIESGAKINLYGPITIITSGNAKLTINGDYFSEGEIIFTPTPLYPPEKSETWKGIVAGVGSIINISDSKFTGAETAVSGTPAKLSVSNCTFTDCTNGIELTACSDFRIIRNTFTGKGEGAAVTVTQSNGWINNNTASYFRKGLNVISCSPLMVQNTITNNVLNGVYTAGFNTYPVMVNPIKVAVVKDTGEDIGIDDSELNNTVLNNGVNYVPPENFINNASQIFMASNSNIYLNEGMNNIYSDGLQVPCIRTRGFIQEGELPKPVIIDAPNNYWGSSVVNDSFFRLSVPYGLIYTPYATFPFGTEPATSAGGSNDIASNFLSKALESELDGKYDKAIRFYEKIIEKYPESTEALVAYAKLPDSYTQDSQIIEPLIELYDQNLESDNTNIKFFKELKVSSHIKAKNYDTAIAQSEEMKLEALNEEEVLLCDLDIAIANMLKNAENKGKGRNESTAADITALLDKLTGGESKGEPADITDAVIPETSKLYQNYPNPFNPVTQIKFDLAKAGNVKLSVYNINGQKVAELVNGIMKAGTHTCEFDGTNLNSGVYYYTLETNGIRHTQKMILTK